MTNTNEVIITNLEFQVNNFKGTGINYDVQAYAQDETESDMYTVEITQVDEDNKPLKETTTCFYVDSCGGMEGDINLNNIEQFVYNILFSVQKYGIMRGF